MDYGTEVRLLRSTPEGEELIEWAGRLCYDTQDKSGQSEDWIQHRIADGHESLIEHASATFYIRASRVLTHELVRHRIASYSQRSQRYVKEGEAKFITPPELAYPEDWSKGVPTDNARLFIRAMERCWETYGALLRAGVKPEIARYALPNACETQIVFTANFRELRHFIKLRTSSRALPEMREVAGKVKGICQASWPRVFSDL